MHVNLTFAVMETSSSGNLISTLIFLLVAGICLGMLWWLIGTAPFLNAMFKTVLQWLVIFFGALLLINCLLTLAGHPIVTFR